MKLEIKSPEFDGLDRGVNITVARHDDYFNVGIKFLDGFQGLDPIHAGDPDVQKDDIRMTDSYQFHGLGAVSGGPDLIALVLQAAAQSLKDIFFIINKEDLSLEHGLVFRLLQRLSQIFPDSRQNVSRGKEKIIFSLAGKYKLEGEGGGTIVANGSVIR